MLFNPEEIHETIRMIGAEHLDIRTTSMGVSLLGGPGGGDVEALCRFVYDRIYERASRLVEVAQQVEDTYGVPICNKRVAVTPISIIADGLRSVEEYAAVAMAMDRVAEHIGIDYIAGYSALVHLGMSAGDRLLLESLPTAMANTTRVCGSANLGTTRNGINMDAVRLWGEVMPKVSEAVPDGSGCSRLVCFCNATEDNPFIAGAFHGVGSRDAVLNVGVSGPGVVLGALRRLKRTGCMNDFHTVSETIKRMSFKIARAGELIGREVADRLGPPVGFGAVDLSLAPTPAIGDSIAEILEIMGLESTGAPGTTAALAMLVDAVKKGGAMASSYVGGLSGAFIPVSEDAGMVAAVKRGSLTLEKLEAMTAVCSVGLDMVAVPGDTPPEAISGIIADEMVIGMVNNKTTAVRIVPLLGKKAGESIDLGGLLGELIAMDVNRFSQRDFIGLRGRIPPPITSVKN